MLQRYDKFPNPPNFFGDIFTLAAYSVSVSVRSLFSFLFILGGGAAGASPPSDHYDVSSQTSQSAQKVHRKNRPFCVLGGHHVLSIPGRVSRLPSGEVGLDQLRRQAGMVFFQ